MNFKKITDSGDDVLSGSKRILGVRFVAGANTSSVVLYNAATQVLGAGDAAFELCKLSVLVAGDVDSEYFEGGITVNNLSVTITGASPVLYIYYV